MKFRFYALKLCLFTIIIFAIQVLINDFTDAFILNENSYFQTWRFLSAIFLHGSLGHLLYNLFALALFGSILEKIIGGFKFLIVFLISGIAANVVAFNFYPLSLGASGAIFGVIGALISIRPMMMVWAFSLPMPIFLAGILWGIGDLIGAYGFITGNPIDSTGNIAHLSGMFFGIIIGLLLRKKYSERRGKKKIFGISESYMRNWEDRHFR